MHQNETHTKVCLKTILLAHLKFLFIILAQRSITDIMLIIVLILQCLQLILN